MSLTKEDLQAISELMDGKLQPINTRLDKMDSQIGKMDSQIGKMDSQIGKMDSQIGKMDSKLDKIEQRVLKIEITQENVVAKQINLLVEGHGDTVNKLQGLDTLTEKLEDIQDTVDVLKHIVVEK